MSESWRSKVLPWRANFLLNGTDASEDIDTEKQKDPVVVENVVVADSGGTVVDVVAHGDFGNAAAAAAAAAAVQVCSEIIIIVLNFFENKTLKISTTTCLNLGFVLTRASLL
jgi:hypothetical protein